MLATTDVDPDSTLTTLAQRQRRSDRFLRGLKRSELQEGARFGTNDLEILDGSESLGQSVGHVCLGEGFQNALDEALRSGQALSSEVGWVLRALTLRRSASDGCCRCRSAGAGTGSRGSDGSFGSALRFYSDSSSPLLGVCGSKMRPSLGSWGSGRLRRSSSRSSSGRGGSGGCWRCWCWCRGSCWGRL